MCREEGGVVTNFFLHDLILTLYPHEYEKTINSKNKENIEFLASKFKDKFLGIFQVSRKICLSKGILDAIKTLMFQKLYWDVTNDKRGEFNIRSKTAWDIIKPTSMFFITSHAYERSNWVLDQNQVILCSKVKPCTYRVLPRVSSSNVCVLMFAKPKNTQYCDNKSLYCDVTLEGGPLPLTDMEESANLCTCNRVICDL